MVRLREPVFRCFVLQAAGIGVVPVWPDMPYGVYCRLDWDSHYDPARDVGATRPDRGKFCSRSVRPNAPVPLLLLDEGDVHVASRPSLGFGLASRVRVGREERGRPRCLAFSTCSATRHCCLATSVLQPYANRTEYRGIWPSVGSAVSLRYSSATESRSSQTDS